MRIINRTIYGSALQTSLLFNIPLVIPENTTLNKKFGILENFNLAEGELPKVQYFCIGNRGHKVVSGADDIPYTMPIQHKASDAALYGHLPFVLRELDNDLSIGEREKYALRKIETVEGVDYYAYYLKRIDMSEVTQKLENLVINNGTSTYSDFIPTESVLSPEPTELPNDTVITGDGVYLNVSALIDVFFSEQDVNEFVNVSEIMLGSADKAIISEIGLCSGVDSVTSGGSPTGPINYREAVAVQIASFITGYYSLGYSNQGFELQIEAGATEPLVGNM